VGGLEFTGSHTSDLRLCMRVAARPLPSTLPGAIRSMAASAFSFFYCKAYSKLF